MNEHDMWDWENQGYYLSPSIKKINGVNNFQRGKAIGEIGFSLIEALLIVSVKGVILILKGLYHLLKTLFLLMAHLKSTFHDSHNKI